MSDYARERARAAQDPLTKANDAIHSAMSDMQAELISKVTALLAAQELREIERFKALQAELIALRTRIDTIEGRNRDNGYGASI